ncbi:MAG: hypothetical protein AB8F94_11750 [Saprospiraceae bacterium]
MYKLKQYNYIFFLAFFFLQQSLCSACNVVFDVELDHQVVQDIPMEK